MNLSLPLSKEDSTLKAGADPGFFFSGGCKIFYINKLGNNEIPAI